MEALDNLFASMPVKKYGKDEMLLLQGTDVRQTFAVKSGVVKCYDLSMDGSQQLISLLAPGDIFPIASVFGRERSSTLFYSAFDKVEVYLIDRVRLVSFLKSHPRELYEVCSAIAHRFSDLHFRVNAAGKPKAREKILHVLAYVADRFKQQRPNGDIEITLPLTHKDIAGLAGLTRETTAAILKQLKDERYIDYNSRRFRVRRKKIEKLLWG